MSSQTAVGPPQRAAFTVLLIFLAAMTVGVGSAHAKKQRGDRLHRSSHIVVIYQENHSFDNLYGQAGRASADSPMPTRRTRCRSSRTAASSSACRRTT